MFLYIHGFNSAPASIKAQQLRNRLAALGRGAEFACPALSPWPDQAIGALEALVRAQPAHDITLVGSSLGGFYATWLAERHGCRAVLVNPAIDPHVGLESYLGPQRNLYTGDEYLLTPGHLDQMGAYFVPQPTRPERYFLLATTGDEVLDFRIAVDKYWHSPRVVVQGSDHGFAEFEQYVDAVIEFGDGGRSL